MVCLHQAPPGRETSIPSFRKHSRQHGLGQVSIVLSPFGPSFVDHGRRVHDLQHQFWGDIYVCMLYIQDTQLVEYHPPDSLKQHQLLLTACMHMAAWQPSVLWLTNKGAASCFVGSPQANASLHGSLSRLVTLKRAQGWGPPLKPALMATGLTTRDRVQQIETAQLGRKCRCQWQTGRLSAAAILGH